MENPNWNLWWTERLSCQVRHRLKIKQCNSLLNESRYGRINQDKLTDILITDPNVHHQEISGLEKGTFSSLIYTWLIIIHYRYWVWVQSCRSQHGWTWSGNYQVLLDTRRWDEILVLSVFHSKWNPVNVSTLSKVSWMTCNNEGNQLMSACWGFDVINQPAIFSFVTIFYWKDCQYSNLLKYYSASNLFTYGIRYKTMLILAGVPTDAPKNISWRFQTPDVVEIVYDPPPEHARNGQVKFLKTKIKSFWMKI